jgi:hypothetical protein
MQKCDMVVRYLYILIRQFILKLGYIVATINVTPALANTLSDFEWLAKAHVVVYTLSIHIVGICIENPTFCTHQKTLASM